MSIQRTHNRAHREPHKTMSTSPKRPPAAKKSATSEPRLSRQRRPEGLAPEDWQRGLRRQYGREQAFELHNLGGEPVFSDFLVTNPATTSYQVRIRGRAAGDNRCTCPDFASNDLGTCKHIEFTLAKLAARRGGKAALARGWEPVHSEVYLHQGVQRGVRWRAGRDCPPRLTKLAEGLFAPDGSLPQDQLDELGDFVTQARRLAQEAEHWLHVEDEVMAFAAQARDAEQRRRVFDAAYPRGAKDKSLQRLLKTRLYPYQAEGALFVARAGRALLADDMGLGKTVQAIAAMELMAQHLGVQRVLIVGPTSLKQQWQREIARFSGREAQVLQGARVLRQRQYAEDAFCRITTYETFTRDLDLAAAWAPDLLILDEAQRVKNWDTQAARALRRLSTPYVLVLTGTPLENRLEELLAIVQLVDPHRLGPTWRLRETHQVTDDAGRVIGYRQLDQLGQTLAPVMLRRRKAEVLTQLPERIDKTLFVPLTPEQRSHHDENGAIVTRIVTRWRQTGFLSDSDQRRLQCALQNMRMACDSTWLLDHETDHGHKADEAMALLEDLLESPEAKVVVFSQWLGMHEVLTRRLQARGWGQVFFHGSVPAEQRGALVDRFLTDPACRLFLATDAGASGLNLQHAAAVVINLDLPWNPAVLEQRIGRVHRLGQSRGVQVFNFVAQGAIEEGMLGLLAFKKSLFSGVLDGGAGEVFLGGTRLSRFMQSVDEVTARMGETDVQPEPAPEPPVEPVQEPAPAKAPADPWAPLLQAGLQFIEQLGEAESTSPYIQTDTHTGQRRLVLPLPEPDTVRRLTEGLSELLKRLG